MTTTSVYPGAVDSFVAPPANLVTGAIIHSDLHRHLADAGERIEAELGINPSGAQATVAARIAALEAGAVVGDLLAFAGSSIPAGWLACDGAAVSRTTYAALFGVLGTTWGAGDGSTTFGLPDLRARVAVGSSPTRAIASSGGSSTITTAGMPAHAHSVGHGHTASTAAGGDHTHATDAQGSHTHTVTSHTGHVHGYGSCANGAGDGGEPSTTGSNRVQESSQSTSTDGAHSHTLAATGDHTHQLSAVADHTHTATVSALSGSTGSTGTGAADGNMPPFAVVAWIIKA